MTFVPHVPGFPFRVPRSASLCLGVIVSQFPETHETFIVRELTALRQAGIPLRIYSLKRCRDRIVHQEARSLLAQTTYVAWDDGHIWAQAAAQLLRHPWRALVTLRWTLRHHAWPPSTCAKAMVVWAQAMALARVMRRDGVAYVHAHWATMPTSAAVLVSRWLGVPFSFTAHAWDLFVRNPSLKAKVRLAQRVITCTEYSRRHLAHRCPDSRDRIILNYHGVDLNRFARFRVSGFARSVEEDGVVNAPTRQRANAPTPLFLSIGRLVDTKGYPTLIDAYCRLRDRGLQFRAVIVGEGPLRHALTRQLHAQGLADTVELRRTLPQDELRRLYHEAFAFVLPCVVAANGDRDGIPNVILEAMACGLPVVSTSVSGIPEAVQDRRTGVLVPPHDVEALARALELLVRRPNVARVFGDHGRMWAQEQFDARVHMSRLVACMKELLGGNAKRGTRTGERELRNTNRGMGNAGQGTEHMARGMGRTALLRSPFPVPRSPQRVPLRVMSVIWSLEVGGAEQVVVSLAGGLDRRRFAPTVVCLNHEGRMAEALRRQGIPVFALHKRPGIDLRMLWRLTRLMRAERPHIVHTHLFGANLWGRLAASLAGVPIVIAHEHGMQPWRGRWHFLLDRWLLPRTNCLLFASRQVQQLYMARTRAPAARCRLVTNGVACNGHAPDRVTARQRLGWREEERVILSVGRLSPEKGYEDLLHAFAIVTQQLPRTRLILVGDGSQRSALEALHARYGFNGRVVLAGTQDDVWSWLAAADVYVQPSHREAVSLAVLSAMAAGLPVIATDVGDLASLVSDGRTGHLVPARDPKALAAKVLQVLQQPEGQRPLIEAAQRLVQSQYSVAQMVRAVERVYEEEIER